jgi:hypothetical protein
MQNNYKNPSNFKGRNVVAKCLERKGIPIFAPFAISGFYAF